MVDVQTIGVLVTAASVSVAAVYYIITLRNNNKTRQAQLFMGIYQQMMTPQFGEAERILQDAQFKNYEEFRKLNMDKEFARAYNKISYWLEGIGVLVREDLVDIRLPVLLYSGMIGWYWEKYGPMALIFRKEMSWPRAMVEAEYLAGRVTEYSKQHPELGIAVPNSIA
jgi:hypothetical protein